MYERITADDPAGPARYGHDFRYQLAAGFAGPEDIVLDAACGTGYGRQFFHCAYYTGVDLAVTSHFEGGAWSLVRADLTKPSRVLTILACDVFVGFETIEHLDDFTTYVEMAKRARKWIIMSAPVVPTVGVNPYHLHDFEPGQLQALLEDERWEHYQTVQQPSEVSEIVVMKRRVR